MTVGLAGLLGQAALQCHEEDDGAGPTLRPTSRVAADAASSRRA